jgi:helix-turn-helix protein
MHLKVSELASKYRFSVDAIYAWVRSGLIPSTCIVRIGAGMRVNSEEFDRLLRDGKLYQPRRGTAEERARHSRDAASSLGLSEDQHTTSRDRLDHQHRFTGEQGAVAEEHPYSAEMKALTR